jgi:hypothetical protein
VLVPRAQEALHALRVVGVPRHRGPVDVPDHDTPTGPQHAKQLGQGGRDVVDVLEDLNGEHPVEVRIGHRQRRDVALVEADVVVRRAPLRRKREHGGAGIDADD